jgi:hypothetical protein
MKQKIVIYDWSLITFAVWSRMGNPQYKGITDIEEVEFTRNLALDMYYYACRFPEAEHIIAMDAPSKGYWRMPYMEDYYRKHATLLQKEIDGELEYILSYNRSSYEIRFSEVAQKWVQKKLNLSTLAKKVLTTYDNVEGIPEYLVEFFPRYKKRVSNWPYQTSQADFKKLCFSLGVNIAKTMNAKWIRVDRAEADDIAQAVSELYPSRCLIFVTDDADWKQIASTHMWANFINPKSKQQFVNLDHETSKYDLWVKIIGGDKSDTVPGIALKNGSGLVAQKRAETLVQTLGYDGLKKYLKQNAVTHTLNRNLKLMVLKNCPEDIKEAIKQAILNFAHKPLPPAKDWKAYTKGVEPIRWLSDSVSIKARAESDARNYLPLHD